MLLRALLLLSTAAIALSATACSSLTKPDEIKIYAEPLPPPKPAAAAPAPGGAAPQQPGHPGGGGG